MVKLTERESFSRLALRFAILTAVRSGEVRGAVWEEFDLGEKLWTIPATRMKASREHVIPLSAPALAILTRFIRAHCGDLHREGTLEVIATAGCDSEFDRYSDHRLSPRLARKGRARRGARRARIAAAYAWATKSLVVMALA
ncbi:tyrosine-type recombinase/integrase [Sphingobium sp. JS3065]|uniref:tyrosine-type recombinase/integrase n=1 Tax=Sphingobium sp. JS3065 TaxID=2970925 RepID=UPI0022642024|nr:tyrosine-type recombinase/integrase [Sphingobium sp. JS3065]UZW54937.1 tyrosine-type recombinase/integrase [Sphingobium sp. JS3065]